MDDLAKHEPRIESFLGQLYSEEHRVHRWEGVGEEEHRDWSSGFRPVLQELIGLTAIRERLGDFSPSVTLGEAEDCGDHLRHRGVLHAEPGFDLPFWFLLPKGEGPFPFGLLPHGHYRTHGLDYAAGVAVDEEMARRIVEEDRDVGVQAARLGYATVAPTTRGFSPAVIPDLNNRHHGSDCRSHMVHALLAGRTATGERVWDMYCLLDWAETDRRIDTQRTFIMGNSGGGVVSLFAAACDPRIKAAVSSCSFCSIAGENGVVHHCDCNLVPGILQHAEAWDLAALIAPRHYLVIHGREDSLFPFSEIERSVSLTREAFARAGCPENFQHAWGDGGHRFYKDLMWGFVQGAV